MIRVEELEQLLTELTQTLAEIEPTRPRDAAVALRRAQDLTERALNEAMAQSVLEGTSMRQLAHDVGLAPNTVASRLSQAPSLDHYAAAGRVTADDLAVERRMQAQPMQFVPRRNN